MSEGFKNEIKEGYKAKSKWQRVIETLKENESLEDHAADLPFKLNKGLIFRVSGDGLAESLCIPGKAASTVF